MIKSYFIVGTDTEVGKTVVSAALLQAIRKQGYTAAGYKPVASGSNFTIGERRNNDALILQANSSISLAYEEVNPYNFSEATSPHIASFFERRPIYFSVLSSGLHALQTKVNLVVVEGAGGWFTPLSQKKTLADWVQHEQLPIVLVVGVKLGCINHAMLTEKAIIQSGLQLKGWIANNILSSNIQYDEYIKILKNLLSSPLIAEVPWIKGNINFIDLANYFNLGHEFFYLK